MIREIASAPMVSKQRAENAPRTVWHLKNLGPVAQSVSSWLSAHERPEGLDYIPQLMFRRRAKAN